ncbi:LacI family DNA-binding transcriptional regulator [Labrys monachus]|uniref:DNA-binding LacI/PurR family transcriptional regulator n=1 Tax=Labrys monachus TaxID=217067 RepID=A0ABU0FK09_9HYPH|nr:LacI family DNA-binding transcriptional regulator [Labrys monachus]MDQ0394682.1 DNA-binding LacI/PurR family transcriptional regulator [Labrys monachus]
MPDPDPARGTASERPTIHDVARLANVSPATVSKVLRGVGAVKADNAARIHQAVRELGFRIDPLAANLRRSRRSIVGLVVPDFRNPFFGSIVAAFERLAESSGYRLVAVSSSEKPEREGSQIEALLDWRVAGLIVVPMGETPPVQASIRDQNVPMVLIDRVPDETGFDKVAVNNAEASAAVIRHLAGLGHRRILVACASPERTTMRERMRGVMAAAEAAGLAGAVEVVACGHDVASAMAAMAERFAAGNLPTAAFALFSPATLAILREVERRGLAVPRDLSVVGFDDVEWMQVTHPPIAAVIQPIEEIAGTAWTQLMHRLANPGGAPCSFEVTCRLDFRASVAPPGQ